MAISRHGRHHVTRHWHARTADRRARAAARRWRHTGSEPRWAQTDLPARRLLSRLFTVLFALGAAGAALLRMASEPPPSPTALCSSHRPRARAVSTAVAIADLYVIRRRAAEQHRWRR